MSLPRIGAVYGSESGTSSRNVAVLAKAWRESGGLEHSSSDIMTGNDAAEKGLEALAAEYDVLVVCTSSYGDGDSPENFIDFIRLLYATQDTDPSARPLKGLQHAGVGFGSTEHTTFQNNPRLGDKLLGELGSRRIMQRLEVDDVSFEAGQKALGQFKAMSVGVFADAKKTASKKEVCPWQAPGNGKITSKKEELLGEKKGEGGQTPLIFGAILALLLAFIVYTQFIATKEA